MNLDWTVSHQLISKWGTLDFNDTDSDTLRRYQVLGDGYKIVPSLRVTQDNISQRDGSVLHPRYTTGIVAEFKVALQVMQSADGPEVREYACGADLTAMTDELAMWLNSMRNLVNADQQRLVWTPGGAIWPRMLLAVELLAWPDPSIESDIEPVVTISLESPYPYAVDTNQNSTEIGDGTVFLLTNDGTADTYPVIQAAGPFTTLDIVNNDSGLEFHYDGSRPGASSVGGGDYAEIDTFRGTVFLNGNSTDLIAGVDPATSDFFPITYGPAGNYLSVSGADITVLWNRAWV